MVLTSLQLVIFLREVYMQNWACKDLADDITFDNLKLIQTMKDQRKDLCVSLEIKFAKHLFEWCNLKSCTCQYGIYIYAEAGHIFHSDCSIFEKVAS
jgi:hypothetical protein